MTYHKSAVTLLATLVAASALTIAVPGVSVAADAAPTGGKLTYQCRGTGSARAAASDVTFELVSQIESAQPGDTLSLSGNLGFPVSASDVNTSKAMFAKEAKIDETDFSLVVRVGGKTHTLEPSSVISTLAPLESPLVLSAYLSYPDLVIPKSATGSVTITMPSAENIPTKVAGTSKDVTFTAHVGQRGTLVSSRDFACWTDEKPGAEATVARIPLLEGSDGGSTGGSSAGGSTDAGGSTAAGGSTTAGGGGAAVPAAPMGGAAPADAGAAPAPVDAPAAAAPAADPAQAPAAGDEPATETSMASAPIPHATSSKDTFIPGWMLALLIAVFPAAAIAGAVLQRRRVRRLRAAVAATV